MSSPNLPDGAFFTTINGRRCTAIPRQGAAPPTTTTARQDTPATTPAQQQPTPSPDNPQRVQPDPPQRDPPQAEPPRQTPVNPPSRDDSPASTARTENSPSPSSPRLDAPPSTAAPIRTLAPPPQASLIGNPVAAPILPPPQPLDPPASAPSSSSRAALPSQENRPVPARPLPTVVDSQDPDRPPAGSLLPSPFPSPQPPLLPSISDSPPPAAETSQTDQNAAPSQNEPDDPNEALQSQLPEPSPTEENGSLITTAPLGPGGIAAGDQAATTRTGPAVGGAPEEAADSNGSPGPPVAAIVGGVVGGVAFLTMLALLWWFWRKNRRHRRSTLLTPLSTRDSSFRKERPYIFDQESVGPTPKSAKFKAALGYSFQRFRGQVGGLFAIGHDRSSGSVLSKDNSQYSNISSHSRHASNVSPATPAGAASTPIKERLGNWKERLAAVVFFSRRNRGEKPLDPDPFAGVREKEERGAVAPSTQPDFLTLLGMDERAVEREAQRRRASRRHGSTASMERFLGDLGINVDNSANPFGDANAIPEEPRRAAPANPFDDSNAVMAAPATRPGANYVADVRRSRNASVSGVMTRPSSMQRPHSSRYDSVYRASGESVESFATRRNRCRSDPFDLERPELLASGVSEPGSAGPRRPGAAHVRNDSFASKYSSGINSAGWSDPGPDIGTSTVIGGRFSPNSGWRPGAFPGREDRKRASNGSQESHETHGSVGKAM